MASIIRNYEREAYQVGDKFLCRRCFRRERIGVRNMAAMQITRAANELRNEVPVIYCKNCQQQIEFLLCFLDQSIKGGKRKIAMTLKVTEKIEVKSYPYLRRQIITNEVVENMNNKLIYRAKLNEDRKPVIAKEGMRASRRLANHVESRERQVENCGAERPRENEGAATEFQQGTWVMQRSETIQHRGETSQIENINQTYTDCFNLDFLPTYQCERIAQAIQTEALYDFSMEERVYTNL